MFRRRNRRVVRREGLQVINADKPSADLAPTRPVPTGWDAWLPGQAVPLVGERRYEYDDLRDCD